MIRLLACRAPFSRSKTLQDLYSSVLAFSSALNIVVKSVPRPEEQPLQLDSTLKPATALAQAKSRLRVRSQDKTFLKPSGGLTQFLVDQQKEADKPDIQSIQYEKYQYMRGEIGLEYTPIDDQVSFKWKVEARRQKLNQEISGYLMSAKNRELADGLSFSLRAWREEILKREEYDEVFKMEEAVRSYPGSKKGPRSEDDPVAFKAHLGSKLSLGDIRRAKLRTEQLLAMDGLPAQSKAELAAFSHLIHDVDMDKIEGTELYEDIDEEAPQIQNEESAGANSVFNYFEMKFEESEQQPQWEDMPSDKKAAGSMHTSWHEPAGMIPSTCPKPSCVNSEALEDFDNWRLMTHKNRTEFQDKVQVGFNVENKAKHFSLYYYYKTLPLALQYNQVVQDAYSLLQHRCPDFSHRDKENALNQICQALQPLDQLSEAALADASIKFRKCLPSEEAARRARQMKPDELFNPDIFFETVFPEQKNSSPYDRQHALEMSRKAYNVPVDYYINDDGFWDDYIEEKHQRYEETPLALTRRYFKH